MQQHSNMPGKDAKDFGEPSSKSVRRLYLDNAATSFPKPPGVLDAITHYATHIGASAGRGAYAEAMASRSVLDRGRELIARVIGGTSTRHVIYTLNCSDALNLAIKGLIDPSKRPHVICTDADHNSILRPLHAMADAGMIELTSVKVDPKTTLLDPDDLRRAVRRNTKLIALTHASNVTGVVQPIRALGRMARELAIPLVVDAAQSVGHVPIDVEADCIDLLAAPGHKALLGPLGTGFLYLRPGIEKMLRPLREGGTGSQSDEPRQPESLPDKYEPGSHNAIGIAGLCAGIEHLLVQGIDAAWQHQTHLVRTFIEGVMDVEGLRYYGPRGVKDRLGVFSVRIDGIAPADLSGRLEREFGILTRSGIHCAPFMHRTIETLESGGTTRLSFGPFVSPQDVKFAADALAQIADDVQKRIGRSGDQQIASTANG
jgi:cysteine desulfurase family protein